jgi:hypothetical protein
MCGFIYIKKSLRILNEYAKCSPPPPSPHVSGVRVTRSFNLCECFVDRCLSFCIFYFGHCVVYSSSTYGFCMTSFIPSTVSLWNNLYLNVRNSPNISCFKSRIKENTGKPPEYYGEGSRKLSILHARQNLFVCLIYARTLLKIVEFSFILISSFPKSNVSIYLLVSLMFLKRQYLSFWFDI